jgi:hypothetical protein
MNLDEFTVHREGDTFYVDNNETVFEVEVIGYRDETNESYLKTETDLTKDEVERILVKVDEYIKDNREISEDERMDNFIERGNIENIY